AVSIDLKKRILDLGENCNRDVDCKTNICRIVDKDGNKCQQTDTRPYDANCFEDAACESGKCIDAVFLDGDPAFPGQCL
ncbi:4230_t:CDS:1, partial [Gigaspora margarita]